MQKARWATGTKGQKTDPVLDASTAFCTVYMHTHNTHTILQVDFQLSVSTYGVHISNSVPGV